MSLKKLLFINVKNRPWRYSRNQSSVAVSAKLIPFKLTDIGEGIAEVELLKWFVKVHVHMGGMLGIVSIMFYDLVSHAFISAFLAFRRVTSFDRSTEFVRFKATKQLLRSRVDTEVS
jgi:hypothetical protein